MSTDDLWNYAVVDGKPLPAFHVITPTEAVNLDPYTVELFNEWLGYHMDGLSKKKATQKYAVDLFVKNMELNVSSPAVMDLIDFLFVSPPLADLTSKLTPSSDTSQPVFSSTTPSLPVFKSAITSLKSSSIAKTMAFDRLNGPGLQEATAVMLEELDPYIAAVENNYFIIDNPDVDPTAPHDPIRYYSLTHTVNTKTNGPSTIDADTLMVPVRTIKLPTDRNPHSAQSAEISPLTMTYIDKHELNDLRVDPCFWTDDKWFVKQDMYIKALPMYDLYTMYAYTNGGAFTTGNYSRGILDYEPFITKMHTAWQWDKHRFAFAPQVITVLRRDGVEHVHRYIVDPTDQLLTKLTTLKTIAIEQAFQLCRDIAVEFKFTKAFVDELMKQGIADLNRIIDNSPVIEHEMVVFHGCKDDFIHPKRGMLYKNQGFVSTTMDIRTAKYFMSGSPTAQLQRIVLPPGTKALFVECLSGYHGQFEIVLSSDIIYYIASDMHKMTITDVQNNTIDVEIDDYIALY